MKQQRGVALITVLLICAIVTLVCSALVARQHLAIRSTSHHLDARQALHYALGAEAAAQGLLHHNWRQHAGRDHLGQAWAQPLPPFALEDGLISLEINDLNGRFNLNSVLQNGQLNALAYARFQRLLNLLELDADYAPRLLDWLDSDQQPSNSQSAEDDQYLRLSPAYRSASQRLYSVSELRLLLGMSEAHYQRLAPWVSALPEHAALNINTASAPVLASLSPTLSLAKAQQIRRSHPQGFHSVNAFITLPELAGAHVDAGGLSIGSDFFSVSSRVQFAGRTSRLVSHLQRDQHGHLHVLSRDLGQSARLPISASTRLENP